MKLYLIACMLVVGCHPIEHPTQHRQDPTDLPSDDEYSSINTAPSASDEVKTSAPLETGANLLKEKERAFRAYQAAVRAYDDYQKVHKKTVDTDVKTFDLK